MKEGEIILVNMPQSDGSRKMRPALILRKLPGYGDYLICGISSQLHQEIKGFDVVIDANHANFSQTGLKKSSVARLAFITSVPSSEIAGAIGRLDSNSHQLLLKRLSDYLLTGKI